MLKNFLLSSFRNFKKNRVFTVLNLLGLAVAIGGIFTIYVFIQNELSVDDVLNEKSSTYLVTILEETESSTREVGLSDLETEKWMNSKNSEIISSHHFRNMGKALLRNDLVKGEQSLTLAQSNFFDYFNLPLIHGDSKTALDEPNSIILSESASKKYFGDANPVGQKLEVYGDYTMPLQVTGVIKESIKTHFSYDCIISWDSRPTDSPQTVGHWYRYSINSYIKTATPEDPYKLASIISNRHREEFPEDNIEFQLYPLNDLYFEIGHVQFLPGYKTGNKTSLTILSLIALLILIIAVVNYVNINISLVLKRLREIGMRKVMGASKLSLGLQFLAESTILVLLASLIAVTLSDLLIKEANVLFQGVDGPFAKPEYLIVLLALSLIIGVLSGLYPALFISRVKLSDGLKSQLNNHSKNLTRNALMGIQFMITFGLLIMSVVVYKQYQFVQTKELGFNKEGVLILNIGDSGKILSSVQSFKNAVGNLPEVKALSVSTDVLGTGYTNNSYYVLKEGQTNAAQNGVMTTYFSVDTGFIPTYNFELLEGRNFNADLASDSSGVIINQVLADKLGLNNPIGERIKLFGDDSETVHIIGVIQNFNFQSLHNEVAPTALYLGYRNFWNLSLQFDSQNLKSLMGKLEHTWGSFDTEVPLSSEFLDDKLARFYEKDQRFSQMIGGFAILSVILSLVGLFGLTAFSMEQKLKEVSIRKVLGADIVSLIILFNKQVVFVFLGSVIVAMPISYLLVGDWLSNFAFHIPNTWWMYLGSAMCILGLIVATVSITSLKAANSNPAKYLRDD